MAWTSPSCARATAATPRVRCTPTRFAENVDGARRQAWPRASHFFSQAVTPDEAREEADFVLGSWPAALDLPVAFDHEPVSDNAGRANRLTGPELAACARAFCERIEQAGYDTLVYGNKRHRPVRRR